MNMKYFTNKLNLILIVIKNFYIINQIPLYIINDGSNISEIFFIIKSFLPRFAKKIFRDIKLKNE